MTLGLGFVWVAADRRRRGWHDMLAGTRVVCDLHAHGAPVGTTWSWEPNPEITPPGYEITR